MYIMVLIGGQALGGPLTGWLAEVLGPQGAIFVAGAVPTAAAAAIGLVLARRGRLRLQATVRGGGPRLRIVHRPSGALGTA